MRGRCKPLPDGRATDPRLKMPGCSGVATFARREIFAAERAFAVMTSHAALPAAGGVMIERLRRCYLPALRLTRAHLVTFVAVNFLMFDVAEANPKRGHHFRRARIASQLMTRPARGNIAAAGLGTRSVTTITGCVGVEAGRNRHGNAAARFAMTSRATHAAHAQVARVIELHAKTFQARKRFQCSRLNIGVTDRADRTLGI